jgi:hypothetical protein
MIMFSFHIFLLYIIGRIMKSPFIPDGTILDSIRQSFVRPDTAFVECSFFIANKMKTNTLWFGDLGASCHMSCFFRE